MECKNCGAEVTGKYCSHCGQKASVGPIDFQSFLQDVSESVFQLNRGFFYTLIRLFQHPGKTIQEFLAGKRRQHFRPIAYALLMSTAYFLVSQLTNQDTFIKEFIQGFTSYKSEYQMQIPDIIYWFAKNLAYTNLLLLPVYALSSWIAFAGLKRNYFEHVVLNAYITGQQALIFGMFSALAFVTGFPAFRGFTVVLSFGYTFWVFWQFFDQGNRVINVLRGLLTWLLYFMISSLLLFLILKFG